MKNAAPLVRCAVYTRKSTEEGLQQEFNSLDAQREAGEAFVKSQQHEGWKLLESRYDDGGYTGGNMDRPALKRLMTDIEAGRVDCVVVYKVDRLSRSLLDFARMMQTFDARKISFVSVTQHFNTTHSMGRLTLNILLSFAQFEREIISERTRDKIAATNRKSGGAEARNKYGALLKGLVKCSSCGCAMTPSATLKGGKSYRYYVCLKAQKKGWEACPTKSVPAMDLERFVLERVRGIGRDPALLRETIRQLHAETQERSDHLDQEAKVVERELVRTARERSTLQGETDRLPDPGKERGMSTLNVEFALPVERPGRRAPRRKDSAPACTPGRVPRVARLMALAIRFDALVASGEVASHAELARLGKVTRARLSQIMSLTHLAPDIQEEILHLHRVRGRAPVILADVLPIAEVVDWKRQREMWGRMG